MQHFYKDVIRLGNVVVSRHAQNRIRDEGISEEAFRRVLLEPIRLDVSDGHGVVLRERDGIRLVILLDPKPVTGVKLVKTVYRVNEQLRVVPRR